MFLRYGSGLTVTRRSGTGSSRTLRQTAPAARSKNNVGQDGVSEGGRFSESLSIQQVHIHFDFVRVASLCQVVIRGVEAKASDIHQRRNRVLISMHCTFTKQLGQMLSSSFNTRPKSSAVILIKNV